MTANFDIIGDIHGHADKLQKLLLKLGYRKQGGCFRQQGRQAIFLGDLIDRGTENFKTIEIVKAMVDNEQALILLGNHEYNALCYHTRDDKGDYLRKHNEKNSRQHETVLNEIAAKKKNGQREWRDYLEWFRGMPLFLEIAGIRVVHACWDRDAVDFFRQNNIRDNSGRLSENFLIKSAKEGTAEFEALETLLKGKEIYLPGDHPGVLDKDGNLRRKVRVKWWLSGELLQEVSTYDQVARINENSLKELKGVTIPAKVLNRIRKEKLNAREDNTPVFFGHYWFTGEPRLLTKTAVCLDYSVGRGGQLVCYRFDGEEFLDRSKFVFV
jgi:hypothetical protein